MAFAPPQHKKKKKKLTSARPSASRRQLPTRRLHPSSTERLEVRLRTRPAPRGELTVGRPGDAFEREADSVADRVTASNAPSPRSPATQGAPTPPAAEGAGAGARVQRTCDACADEGDFLQRAPARGRSRSTAPSAPKLASALALARSSGGRPLDREPKRALEPLFGRSFDHVRVHTDGEASRLAKSVNAKAFTVGQDVFFGPGQYRPETTSGKRLIAHELVHTVQQEGGARVQRDVLSEARAVISQVDDDRLSPLTDAEARQIGQRAAYHAVTGLRHDLANEILNQVDATMTGDVSEVAIGFASYLSDNPLLAHSIARTDAGSSLLSRVSRLLLPRRRTDLTTILQAALAVRAATEGTGDYALELRNRRRTAQNRQQESFGEPGLLAEETVQDREAERAAGADADRAEQSLAAAGAYNDWGHARYRARRGEALERAVRVRALSMLSDERRRLNGLRALWLQGDSVSWDAVQAVLVRAQTSYSELSAFRRRLEEDIDVLELVSNVSHGADGPWATQLREVLARSYETDERRATLDEEIDGLIGLTLGTGREADRSRAGVSSLGARYLGERREREANVGAQLEQLRIAFPFLGRGTGNTSATLRAAVRLGMTESLAALRRARGAIESGRIHPFQLPAAVRAVRADAEGQPDEAGIRQHLDRALSEHRVDELVESLAWSAFELMIGLLPVVGPELSALVHLSHAGGAALGAVQTFQQLQDLAARAVVANAGSADEGVLGVAAPEDFEWVFAAAEGLMTFGEVVAISGRGVSAPSAADLQLGDADATTPPSLQLPNARRATATDAGVRESTPTNRSPRDAASEGARTDSAVAEPNTRGAFGANRRPRGADYDLRLGDEAHNVSVGFNRGVPRFTLCSRVCGPLQDRLAFVLGRLPDGHASRAELGQMVQSLSDLERGFVTGRLSEAMVYEGVGRVTARVEALGLREPEVSALILETTRVGDLRSIPVERQGDLAPLFDPEQPWDTRLRLTRDLGQTVRSRAPRSPTPSVRVLPPPIPVSVRVLPQPAEIGITPGGVLELEVGRYRDLAPRSVGDGLTPDHIPSARAVREHIERQLGRPLTPSETRRVHSLGQSIVVRSRSHTVHSRTFGGRNRSRGLDGRRRFETDADDLAGALRADQDAWRQVLLDEGHSHAAIDAAFDALEAAQRADGVL